mmetsp:Transcript_104275/g.299873  ORF Transcript_104275/g.299873 Transcript_104275/m.299873 type:complete len:206 (-) Transcript_104275:65-682(-)
MMTVCRRSASACAPKKYPQSPLDRGGSGRQHKRTNRYCNTSKRMLQARTSTHHPPPTESNLPILPAMSLWWKRSCCSNPCLLVLPNYHRSDCRPEGTAMPAWICQIWKRLQRHCCRHSNGPTRNNDPTRALGRQHFHLGRDSSKTRSCKSVRVRGHDKLDQQHAAGRMPTECCPIPEIRRTAAQHCGVASSGARPRSRSRKRTMS